MHYCSPISGHEFPIVEHCEFTVTTCPRPQTRPRVLKSGRVVSSGKHVRAFKTDIVFAARAAKLPKPPPKDVPLLLEIEFTMPVKRKALWGRLHTGRPDLDNMVKAVKDALVDAGVIEDDSQVVSTDAFKAYGEPPGMVRIRISKLSPPTN